MEATGLYGLDVALLLSAHPGVQLMVANPRAVRDFAKAMIQRSKSDPLDARMLREFAARMPPAFGKLFPRPCAAAFSECCDLCSAKANNCEQKRSDISLPMTSCSESINCCAAPRVSRKTAPCKC